MIVKLFSFIQSVAYPCLYGTHNVLMLQLLSVCSKVRLGASLSLYLGDRKAVCDRNKQISQSKLNYTNESQASILNPKAQIKVGQPNSCCFLRSFIYMLAKLINTTCCDITHKLQKWALNLEKSLRFEGVIGQIWCEGGGTGVPKGWRNCKGSRRSRGGIGFKGLWVKRLEGSRRKIGCRELFEELRQVNSSCLLLSLHS